MGSKNITKNLQKIAQKQHHEVKCSKCKKIVLIDNLDEWKQNNEICHKCKQSTMKITYTTETWTLNADDLKKMKLVNPRKVRKSQVKKILNSLLSDVHFDSCMVIHRKGNEIHVIDGQHRILAMIEFFKYPPRERSFFDKIEVLMIIYDNLTLDEERQIFHKWNVNIKQETEDVIFRYKDTIPMYQKLIGTLPVSCYGSTKKMKIKFLMFAFISSNEKPYKGCASRSHLTTYDFVRFLQSITESDIEIMKKNFNILIEIFNPDGYEDFCNILPFKNIIFRALYYLVSNNTERLGEKYIKYRMKRVLAKHTIMESFRGKYGRQSSVDAYATFKHILNAGTSEANKFI